MHILQKPNDIRPTMGPLMSFTYKNGGTAELSAEGRNQIVGLSRVKKDVILHDDCREIDALLSYESDLPQRHGFSPFGEMTKSLDERNFPAKIPGVMYR